MRSAKVVPMILPLALGLCACRRSGESQAAAAAPAETAPAEAAPAIAPGQAPTGIFYPSDPATFSKGVAAPPMVPYTTGGTATGFRISPSLPAGLALDPATGAIGGTPAGASPAKDYQITASNAAGSFTKTLSLAVLDQPPGQAPAITLAPALTAGEPGQTASTQDQGAGASYTWTLTGGTVTGGQGTATVTFTPGGPGRLTAQVAVSTTGGTVTGRAEAQVLAAPDATLTLPTWVRPGATGPRASVPAQPGMTYAWALVPGDATGTLTSGQGTNQVTFSVGSTPGTFQVEVTVTNSAGRSASNRGTITVKPS